jgi:hypothetical protein
MEAELNMFTTFNIMVRDGMPVEAVHEAFLAIDRYRARVSTHTFGIVGRNNP